MPSGNKTLKSLPKTPVCEISPPFSLSFSFSASSIFGFTFFSFFYLPHFGYTLLCSARFAIECDSNSPETLAIYYTQIQIHKCKSKVCIFLLSSSILLVVGLKQSRPKMKLFWVGIVVVLVLTKLANGFEEHSFNETELSWLESYGESKAALTGLMVGLTLIPGAGAKGAVCLDGTLPGYHLHRGYGSGANSWLIQLEGGGWCNTIRNCVYRKTTRRGSSKFMEKQLLFTGILSNKAEENPDFFNWNRVKLRYCDGASFSGDSENKAAQLQFRGQRIWLSAMQDLMSKGMRYANQALLSGCSAGGLASILHCDEFRGLFSTRTKVKCLSDAGLFLDAADVSGGRTLRNLYGGVVGLQGVQETLPRICLNHLDPTSCFFPQNLINSIKTPLFILNAAYDSWQIQSSLAPPSADPRGYWKDCRLNHAKCSSKQIQFLQGFRNQMLNVVRQFAQSDKNGLFINSCFAHCQSERQDTWFADNSPVIKNKAIALAVGDWYFERTGVKGTKAFDCPYPCDNSCHNLVFQRA